MAENEVPEAPKKNRKLLKEVNYETGVITIEAVGGSKGVMTFPFADLPETMQAKLGPFGASHKLGDAASSVKGVEAENAILRVWEGMKKNEWSTRSPSTPKIPLADIAANYKNLDPKQQKIAKQTLELMGIKLPPELIGD